jgi:hypothetical protein
MKFFIQFIIILMVPFTGVLLSQNAYEVYINEIRANDESTDDLEFIELIGPAGTDLSGFQIIHYNGVESVDGGLWSHTIDSFIIPDDGAMDINGRTLGFYVLGCSNNSIDACDEVIPQVLQNGADGIILYDAVGTILDAVAWQNAGDLPTDDPGTVTTIPPVSANNFLHITANDDAGDNSLQAPNDVLNDDGSGWQLDAASPGALNASQSSGDIHLPVELISFTAKAGDKQVILTWSTASEINNMGFILERAQEKYGSYTQIAHYKTHDALKASQNSSQQKNYQYTDHYVYNDITYWYKLIDVDRNGRQTEKATLSAMPNANGHAFNPSADGYTPQRYTLGQNTPNPFNPSTIIRFNIPEDNFIKLSVYNLVGQKIKSLVQDWLPAGTHCIHWDGINEKGEKVPSGIYFYTLMCDQFFASKKMILTR